MKPILQLIKTLLDLKSLIFSKLVAFKSKRNKGYTLIEILVATAIFFVVIAGPTGLFVASLRSQARALALRETIDNTSHIIEYISRALRMARKDMNGACIGLRANYENPENNTSTIRFLNYSGVCQEFSLDNERLKERKSTDGDKNNFGADAYLTSDDLKVNIFKFKLSGEGQDDNLQPRVTMVLEIGKKGQPESSNVRIQTTVSQRNLDVTY